MDYILGIKYIAWKQPMEGMSDSNMQIREDEELLSDESFELSDDDEV